MSGTRLLEVIALSPADAVAAQAGGADRVELVSDMAADGLSPTPHTVADVLSSVDIPVRVMLRTAEGFAATDPDGLRRTAGELREAGAHEFVLGFLTADGAIDLAGTELIAGALGDAPWTFHRAVDHCADRNVLWRSADRFAGLDTVLTAGAASGVNEGIDTLLAEAEHRGADTAQRILVGGGLQLTHLPRLKAAGINAFHIGGAARPRGWDEPVAPDAVRRWRDAIDA